MTPSIGCDVGEVCSPYGLCVPQGLTCPTDGDGQPNFLCTANADCAACSPLNQVCEGTPARCRACSVTNTQSCTQNDVCIDGDCAPRCPASCSTNNDCQHCGGPGNEAHACFRHICSQCNDTDYPCTSGLVCDNGACVPPCGAPAPEAGRCVVAEDCYWCGGQNAYDTWTCVKPANANPLDHGTCGPDAAGCADLGNGASVLPEPWGSYTSLCSTGPDCSTVSVAYDVGALVRDLASSDVVDLGFTTVPICDASVELDLPRCAEVSITDSIQCGVCVPCQTDADCPPVPLEPMLSALFCDDELAPLAGAMLFDQLWREGTEHELHFFCQPIGPSYGVCAPCANPTSTCSSTGGAAGSCSHDVCALGAALGSQCSDCTAAVCAADDYCCNVDWDAMCVAEVSDHCVTGCGGGSLCDHSPCVEGGPLAAGCGDCTEDLCLIDPFCCSVEWDDVCVGELTSLQSCVDECNGTGCAHSECVVGVALAESCSACATSVCSYDDYCCDPAWGWDDVCVTEAHADGACSC